VVLAQADPPRRDCLRPRWQQETLRGHSCRTKAIWCSVMYLQGVDPPQGKSRPLLPAQLDFVYTNISGLIFTRWPNMKYNENPVSSAADPDPGSSAFLTPGSGMGKKSGFGSGMYNPDHISECLETILGLKYLNSLMRIRVGKKSDPDSGSATLPVRMVSKRR
jgi:hypothetical protein